jgi:hypothetical protein
MGYRMIRLTKIARALDIAEEQTPLTIDSCDHQLPTTRY